MEVLLTCRVPPHNQSSTLAAFKSPHMQADDFFDDDFFDMDFDMDFGFGSSCTKVTNPEDYPSYRAMWSCGMKVRGAAVCVPGGWVLTALQQPVCCYNVG